MITFQVKGGVIQSGRWKDCTLFCRPEWDALGFSDGLLRVATGPFDGGLRLHVFDLGGERFCAIHSKPFKGMMPVLIHTLSQFGFDPVTNIHFYVGMIHDKGARPTT